MIHTKYVPKIESIVSSIINTLNKNPSELKIIEVPADLYDSVIKDLKQRISSENVSGISNPDDVSKIVLRGEYPYETIKNFAMSGLIESLTYNERSGEITTKSTAGISVEVIFAVAVWNGYQREDAIDRAFLWVLKNNADNLSSLISQNVGNITIKDGTDIEKSFAKELAKKAKDFFVSEPEGILTKDDEIVYLPRDSKFISKIEDNFSYLTDEFTNIIKYGEDIKDLVQGRISKKQFLKNFLIKLAGKTGVAVMSGLSAVTGGVIVGFFFDFSTKVWFKQKAKLLLDIVIDDDRKGMLEILSNELAEFLDGKFLTPYELEILTEALLDALNKDILKDMYSLRVFDLQVKFAQEFITQHVENIFGQRKYIKKPSRDEWASGFNRVIEGLSAGENFVANMNEKRNENLAMMRAKLDEYKLKPYEAKPIVQAVNAVSKIQAQERQSLQKFCYNESVFQEIHSNNKNIISKNLDDVNKILQKL